MGKKSKESPIVSFRVPHSVVEKLITEGRLKPSHIKSELSNLIKNDWLASVDAGVEATVSVNTVYEQLAKIDRVLEILEDNKPNGVIDDNVDSVEKISLPESSDSISPDNQLVEVANSNVHRVEQINGDNTPVSVVDDNEDSVEKISLPESSDSILPDNQLVEVANSNVHPVEEINGDNTPVSVVDENSIESLNLKRNTYTALLDAQVNTIEDLKKYGVTGLKTLKNLGNKSVSQIVEALQSRGIELPELPDPEPEHTPSL
ncbi:DNA-directed RNA polymerase subunit alpha C-terminal domain-containing protein [Nostoc sp. UHCC 0252]|uniref:DNA-directed RNA polymerase subunit alpha C-terminal domain-containing protein n=1 Tax=Nostoc sp. UHCC 0252 TaxID=3110241 RepID=UPI002B21E9BC|nr:DNA-directed RNA polymerase subunit alpha C-terminal domain-containing protein [Nostoc sp. UHCC 0252]MEA5605448.1 DNA-directed RNA polymerase subunit alpha C-terminal domain-containing protein [Nostoc sp. UHCC 0252]